MKHPRNDTSDKDNRKPAFERISEQDKNARGFAQKPENICGSDVPAADGADVNPARFRHQKSRWNRAQQIGRKAGEDVTRNEHAIVYGCISGRWKAENLPVVRQ